jgi:hypothetical protein
MQKRPILTLTAKYDEPKYTAYQAGFVKSKNGIPFSLLY